jgi:oligoendopeptidase F
VADKLKSDKLRKYPSPMSARNLGNDVKDQVVNNLLDAVESALPLAREWWRAKAAAMGLSKLSIFDQAIELGNARKITYGEAQQTIDRALNEFAPELAGYVRDIYRDQRIDAESRLGKQGGAYCHPGLLDGKPYILCNFQGRMDDMFTMQHEFGHGIHDVLSYRKQNVFSAHPPLVLAEIASTFNELVLQDYLMRTETDPATRLALTSGDVSSTIATVYRQATMCRYEQKAFELRSQHKELTASRLSQIWWQTQTEMFAGAVEAPPIYRLGWAYIPHFIGSPFYVYSYAFAQLSSLALYDKWKQEGPAFVPKYLEFLAAGGSQPTDKLLAKVGIDIHDPHCWDGAISEFGRRVQEAISLIPGSSARAA